MADRPWEKEGWVTMSDEEHEIRGVTPEMIDWWWDNMEKGYPLWHPVDHHDFKWAEGKSPGEIGHIGAVQIADQSRGAGAPRTGGKVGTWLDVSSFPFPIDYDHCLVLEGFSQDKENQDFCVHMYSATDYGTKHRFIVIMHRPRANKMKEARESGKLPPQPTWNGMGHFTAEAYCWEQFLPTLWKLWQVVKDPECNPQCDLRIKKMPGGRYAYVTPQTKPGVK